MLALSSVAAGATGGGKGKPRGGGGRTCTPNPPGVSVDNNWAWSQTGSWGLRGQQLTYALQVRNYDVGCSASSFVVTAAMPNGFSVSMRRTPSASSRRRRLPVAVRHLADHGRRRRLSAEIHGHAGRNLQPVVVLHEPLKVYSSDSVAPTLYWPSPGDGATITGRSYNVAVSANDDHAVKRIELYLDNPNAPVSTTTCDDVPYTCQLIYSWSTTAGQHWAKFVAYDWLGNHSEMLARFTVS
jgi:hypothetical protein